MKIARNALLLIVIALSLAACSRRVYIFERKPLPPGQAKKITGSKSAKPYAPGHQKRKRH